MRGDGPGASSNSGTNFGNYNAGISFSRNDVAEFRCQGRTGIDGALCKADGANSGPFKTTQEAHEYLNWKEKQERDRIAQEYHYIEHVRSIKSNGDEVNKGYSSLHDN